MKTRIVVCSLISLAIYVGVILSNPLRSNADTLRLAMLQKTPLGTPLSDVEKIANSIGKHTIVSLTTGFYKQSGASHNVVGVKSIETSVGNYWTIPPIPIRTSVKYYWGFDENARLVDIWVWKTTDAP